MNLDFNKKARQKLIREVMESTSIHNPKCSGMKMFFMEENDAIYGAFSKHYVEVRDVGEVAHDVFFCKKGDDLSVVAFEQHYEQNEYGELIGSAGISLKIFKNGELKWNTGFPIKNRKESLPAYSACMHSFLNVAHRNPELFTEGEKSLLQKTMLKGFLMMLNRQDKKLPEYREVPIMMANMLRDKMASSK